MTRKIIAMALLAGFSAASFAGEASFAKLKSTEFVQRANVEGFSYRLDGKNPAYVEAPVATVEFDQNNRIKSTGSVEIAQGAVIVGAGGELHLGAGTLLLESLIWVGTPKQTFAVSEPSKASTSTPQKNYVDVGNFSYSCDASNHVNVSYINSLGSVSHLDSHQSTWNSSFGHGTFSCRQGILSVRFQVP